MLQLRGMEKGRCVPSSRYLVGTAACPTLGNQKPKVVWEIKVPKEVEIQKKLNSFHRYKYLVDWYPSCLMMSFENVVWWQIHFIQVLFFLNRGEPGSAAESLSRIATKTSTCRSQHILVVSRLGCPEITRNWIKI